MRYRNAIRQTYHLLTVATLPKVDNIKGEGRLQRTLRNIPLTTLSKYILLNTISFASNHKPETKRIHQDVFQEEMEYTAKIERRRKTKSTFIA
jgi:hypothetical protein